MDQSDLFGFVPPPPTREQVEREAVVGMTRAADHAERVSDGWKEAAYEFLVRFAQTNLYFVSEDVSGASKNDPSFEQPPTDRAWGSVYRRAIKNRIIVRDGTGKSMRRHASICPRWRSVVNTQA